MAPTRPKKRNSSDSSTSVDVQSFPAPPHLIPTKMQSPTRTPTGRSPIRKQAMGITIGQKQALIDNLQLEITERARKLRAQYMMQAQGLRTRIEIRVNRIPTALRRAKMGDLLLKHSENRSNAGPVRISPGKHQSPAKNLIQIEQSRASPSPQRRTKRHSDDIATDKENEDIENPKKRIRGAPQPPDRTTSRANLKPDQVLSPRSANSRTYPKSPVRSAAPTGKSLLARPISPVKATAPVVTGGAASILTNMVEKAKATRGAATRKATEVTTAAAGVGRGKRTAAVAPVPKAPRGRATSDSSNHSGSTVIRKNAPVAKKSTAPVTKRTVMNTIKGIGAGAASKKAPGPKVAAPVTGGRVLRKRN